MSHTEDSARAPRRRAAVLAEIIDPESELTASAATRQRIQGAVRALGALRAVQALSE